jgi:hypothetical protein
MSIKLFTNKYKNFIEPHIYNFLKSLLMDIQCVEIFVLKKMI